MTILPLAPQRRLRLSVLAVLLVSLIVLTVTAAMRWSDDAPELTGTDLRKHPSPGFDLVDHRGQPVSLESLRGRAVALTFIYTSCPDVCPLIAARMGEAYAALPTDDRENVALVAITIDPERDTPEALREFSSRFSLDENPGWFALTGTRPQLASVWKSYGIEPGDFQHEESHGEGHNQTPDDHDASSPAEMLSHTDAIYFIDPDGQERALLRGDASPESIVQNLRAMLESD